MDTPNSQQKWAPESIRHMDRGRLAKTTFIVLVAILLVSLIISSVLYFTNRPKIPTKVESALMSAKAASDKGNYQKSIQDLKAAVNEVKTTQEKVAVYSRLALAASSAGNLDEAIHYYELKHQLAPDTIGVDASMLATIFERDGQNDKAISQYRLAIKYVQSRTKEEYQRDAYITLYNSRIKNLESGRQ